MAKLTVDDKDLVVHLTLGEKVWGFHGGDPEAEAARIAAAAGIAPSAPVSYGWADRT